MTNLTNMATTTAAHHHQPNAAWTEHKSGAVTDTTYAAEEMIRRAHPDLHLTRVSPAGCDLIEYAQAGHAEVRRDPADFRFEATREFIPPGSRVGDMGLRQMGIIVEEDEDDDAEDDDVSSSESRDKSQKKATVEDKVSFGRWTYKWQGNTFLVYEVVWLNDFGNEVPHFFVLAPPHPDASLIDECNTADHRDHHCHVVDGHHRLTDALILACGEWSRELHDEIWVFDNSAWAKSRSLWRSVQGSTWDDVVLDPAVKSSLIADVQGFFDNRDLYKSLRIPWKRGVILHGSPGNGKTVSIKALINSLAKHPKKPVQSLYVKSLDACNGPKWSIQEIFRKARRCAPCLLVFEDLDSLVEDETRSYFLNEVDGLESNDGILMIGSTNHLHRLDPAITKRPSRFDRKYHYALPARAEREAYAMHWRDKVVSGPVSDSQVDWPVDLNGIVADLTEGYSFAYMKELFITSLLLLARGGEDVVGGDAPDYDSDVEEEDAEAEEAKDKDQSGKTSPTVSDTVMVDDKDLSSTDKATQTKKQQKRKRRTLPEVEIPEMLRDHVFLGILKRQAALLLEELDTAFYEEDSAKKAVPGGGGDNGFFGFSSFAKRCGPKRRRC